MVMDRVRGWVTYDAYESPHKDRHRKMWECVLIFLL